MLSSRSIRTAPTASRTQRIRRRSLERDPMDFVPLLLAWFVRAARDLPWRQTLDPYAIWVSEIMLQQTQVKTVIPYWIRWMQELPDVLALAQASQERVLKLWEGLGYYTRARNLQNAARRITEQWAGRFPQQHADVLSLPGIGRYTAGAICSIAYNQPTPILDGNVIRVLTRLCGLAGDPRDKRVNDHLWKLATAAVERAATTPLPKTRHLRFTPSGACSALNQALMELGALICTPKQPRCAECPLQANCRALATRRVDQLPSLPARTKATERRFIAFALQHRGRWLVHQRPAGTVNAHLWEFPAFEIAGANQPNPATVLFQELTLNAPRLEPLPAIRHSITRYRITVTPFHARLAGHVRPPTSPARLVWRTTAEIEALALTSAHRKLWKNLARQGLRTGPVV